jgi:hypothetical protein
VALLVINLAIAAASMWAVSTAARRSRSRGLKAVAAVEPASAS